MIPTTVFTGSLGAGKTTIILNLVEQLSKEYKTIWLKNEYGDVNIDSELAKESNIQTKEILNGCLCCVLVGKLHNALEEIAQKYKPDRLIIETAGTAYPYPIIQEVNRVEQLQFDGLISVQDALNFEKFKDKSINARNQAKYVDLVIINKWEEVQKDKLEKIEDEIWDLYPTNPKIKSNKGFVNKDLILGIDVKGIELSENKSVEIKKEGEETHEEHQHNHSGEHEIEIFSFEFEENLKKSRIEDLLNSLKEYDFYRIKGILKVDGEYKILNYVVDRFEFSDIKNYKGNSKITFMGNGIKNLEQSIKKELQ